MKLTNITTNKNGTYTNLIGKLIDEKGCDDFREFNELCLHMTKDIEVIEL